MLSLKWPDTDHYDRDDEKRGGEILQSPGPLRLPKHKPGHGCEREPADELHEQPARQQRNFCDFHHAKPTDEHDQGGQPGENQGPSAFLWHGTSKGLEQFGGEQKEGNQMEDFIDAVAVHVSVGKSCFE